MKSNPGEAGVNFTNVLRTAFALVDPEIIRTQSSRQYHFTLLGSKCVKAVRRTLMKLSPGVNFINVLHTAFALVDPERVKITAKSSVSFYAFSVLKGVRRLLMKLTPRVQL